jgi:mono/diheme cytochrome c family protein
VTKIQRIKLALVVTAVLLAGLIYEPSASAHEGHKRKNAPVSAKRLKNKLAATNENIAAGRALFTKHCAACHGADGKAQTAAAQALKPKPTDLTGKAMQGITDGEIYWVITHGIRAAKMPAYKTKATDRERWQMTLYVKHLMGTHPHAGATKR